MLHTSKFVLLPFANFSCTHGNDKKEVPAHILHTWGNSGRNHPIYSTYRVKFPD
jgi:hypothetical protein